VRLAGVVLVAGGLLTAVGCRNACQDVCRNMADFAAEDCGIQVSDADLDACYARQKSPEREDAKACRDFGDVDSIRNQWSCEELSGYFGGGES
jgi:hypothetical protein